MAASGLRVTLYEAGPAVGGRCGAVQAGGYRFDKGPTFFMMPYVLDEVFRAAGRRLEDYAELTRLDPMYRLIVGKAGGADVLDATQDLGEMARRIARLHPRDGASFLAFIEHNRAKLRHSEPILRHPMTGPLSLFGPGTWRDTLKVAPLLRPHQTVYQLLSKYFRHPAVRLAMGFQSKYLGMSPYECPSLFTILPFIEYEYGVWHPTGGCSALSRAMAELAGELGVEVRTDTPVREILFSGNSARGPRATGLRTDAGEERHDHLVINADATWALKHLIPPGVRARAGREYDAARIDAMRYSCSTYMLYLGVRGGVNLPHHTIYVSAAYEDNLADITERGVLSEDPSAYVCNPSVTDPTLAPPGCSSLYVLLPTPNCKAAIDWPARRAEMRERALNQLEGRFGLTEIRSRIEREEEITPDDWRGQNINFGATFNLAHNLGQMLHNRPQNRLRGFENLYLVGGGTHPGSGLPTIFLSAQISSRLICDQAGVMFAGVRPVSIDAVSRSAPAAVIGG